MNKKKQYKVVVETQTTVYVEASSFDEADELARNEASQCLEPDYISFDTTEIAE